MKKSKEKPKPKEVKLRPITSPEDEKTLFDVLRDFVGLKPKIKKDGR